MLYGAGARKFVVWQTPAGEAVPLVNTINELLNMVNFVLRGIGTVDAQTNAVKLYTRGFVVGRLRLHAPARSRGGGQHSALLRQRMLSECRGSPALYAGPADVAQSWRWHRALCRSPVSDRGPSCCFHAENRRRTEEGGKARGGETDEGCSLCIRESEGCGQDAVPWGRCLPAPCYAQLRVTCSRRGAASSKSSAFLANPEVRQN